MDFWRVVLHLPVHKHSFILFCKFDIVKNNKNYYLSIATGDVWGDGIKPKCQPHLHVVHPAR